MSWQSYQWCYTEQPPNKGCANCGGRGWTEYVVEYIAGYPRFEDEYCLCTLREPCDRWTRDRMGRWV